MAEVSTSKRSYLAMCLSIGIPGLGQLYLRKPLEGMVLFFGVVFAGFLIYINSLPVTRWRDVTHIEALERWWGERFAAKERGIDSEDAKSRPDSEPGRPDSILLIEFNGTQLMYRPTWHFKVSGLIQGLVFWLYAIYDGWRGQRGFSRRAFKKKLKDAQKQREAQVIRCVRGT